MVFIASTYLFFVAGLLIFYALLVWAPTNIGQTSGQVFYVWFSVFNLFATMLFWALMTDRFTPEQSERLFGAVALGPFLGGVQAEAHAWRPLFWIVAGIALLALLMAVLTFEDAPPADPSAPTDLTAIALAAVGCAAAFIGVKMYRVEIGRAHV